MKDDIFYGFVTWECDAESDFESGYNTNLKKHVK